MPMRTDRNIGLPVRKGPAWARAVAALAALGALAACAGDGGRTAELTCPRVAILRDADRIVEFRPGSAQQAQDVVSRATLSDITGSCLYDDEGVTVEFQVALVAERGPALEGDRREYRYFVAVLDPAERILARRDFAADVTFPPGAPRAGTAEELVQHIPLAEGADGAGYRVLLGFALSRDQLEFNIRQRERR